MDNNGGATHNERHSLIGRTRRKRAETHGVAAGVETHEWHRLVLTRTQRVRLARRLVAVR